MNAIIRRIIYLVALAFLIYAVFYGFKLPISNDSKNEDAFEKTSKEEASIKKFYEYLSKSENKVYSQNKEDGVTEAIFNSLNIPNLKKTFVEFSPADGKFWVFKKYINL